MTCICNPLTDQDRFDLEHYGCPETICPGCYNHKQHDDPYCQDCMDFLDNVGNQLKEPLEPATLNEMEKILYIMQGVPGSGKSVLAKMIVEYERGSGKRVAHLSTDDWRFDDDGVYVFDPEDNVRYHRACQQACAQEMIAETEVIVIDNTNIQEWQAHPYLVMADMFNYTVQVVSVDGGLHHAIKRQALRQEDRRVPKSVIIDMYWRMERLLAPPEDVLIGMQQQAQLEEAGNDATPDSV